MVKLVRMRIQKLFRFACAIAGLSGEPKKNRGALRSATLCRKTFPGKVRGTADPSASLPRISCGTWWALADLMRLSLKKGEHANMSSAAWQEIRVGMTKGRVGFLFGIGCAIPGKSDRRAAPIVFRPTYPDFLHGAPLTSACAAFIEESRIKFAYAGKLDRKSGVRLGERGGTRPVPSGRYDYVS
jgi:hypothetical protein